MYTCSAVSTAGASVGGPWRDNTVLGLLANIIVKEKANVFNTESKTATTSTSRSKQRLVLILKVFLIRWEMQV